MTVVRILSRDARRSRRVVTAAATLAVALMLAVTACSSHEPTKAPDTTVPDELAEQLGRRVDVDPSLIEPAPAVVESLVAVGGTEVLVSVFVAPCHGIQHIDTEDRADQVAVGVLVGVDLGADDCSGDIELVTAAVRLDAPLGTKRLVAAEAAP